MRYMQYFTRSKYLFGLSKYNEDDTVYEREEEFKELFRDNWFIIQNCEIKEQKRESKKRGCSCADNPIVKIAKEMRAQKVNPFDIVDKMVDEFLLNTYLDIDEQEFLVCRTTVWAMWDLNSGHDEIYYMEVVARLLSHRNIRRDIFPTIKDIEATIRRLVHKGILSQDIDYITSIDVDRNITQELKRPFIILSFSKDSGDIIKEIGETFCRLVNSFLQPHTDYYS
jgi:hypothetical protein